MNNPIQPLVQSENGLVRFKANKTVQMLLAHGEETGLGMNELRVMFDIDECQDDWQQLAQLIGYSLSGYGKLSYVDDEAFYKVVELAPKE